MGYYLPHRSYLRPRQKAKATQRIISVATATVTITAAVIIFTSLEFGNNKSALADVKPETLAVKSLSPVEVKEPVTLSKSIFEATQLAFFNVDIFNQRTEIKFATQEEYDVDYFSIEKSVNGGPFKEITCMESQGNQMIGSEYTYTDNEPGSGMLFYRLKQTLDNGKTMFIGLEKVSLQPDGSDQALFIDHIGPEPFDKFFNIGYFSEREGGVAVEIFDRDGKNIFKSYTMAAKGYNTCRFIEGSELLQDQYTIRIANSSGACVKKIRKKA